MLMGDNGFMFGEHGLIDKRVAYETSIRVPLLAFAPGKLPAGVTIDSVVSNLDIAPTILGIAGVEAPDYFDGRSFANMMQGKEQEWSNEMVYEYYWDVTFPQTPTTFAIRTDRYKYISYQGVWDLEELYDLEQDPTESTNLVFSEEHAEILGDLRARLYKRLKDSSGDYVVPYEVKRGPGHVYRNENYPGAAPFPGQWYREPLADSAEK